MFAALADPTRRDIVARVFRQQLSVSVLAEVYPMSFAAVQKHVSVLERAGLVSKHRHGRERLVRGDVTAVRVAAGLLDDYERTWRDRVARIEDLLAGPDPAIAPDQAVAPDQVVGTAPPDEGASS